MSARCLLMVGGVVGYFQHLVLCVGNFGWKSGGALWAPFFTNSCCPMAAYCVLRELIVLCAQNAVWCESVCCGWVTHVGGWCTGRIALSRAGLV
jgi:hypothetical protein